MSDNGESDLDVFKSLTKGSGGPPHQTLIGQPGPGSHLDRSMPPAPPSSAELPRRPPTAPPPAPIVDAEGIDETTLLDDDKDDIEEVEPDFEEAEATAFENEGVSAAELLAGPSQLPPPSRSTLSSSVPPPGLAPPPVALAPPSRPSLPPPSVAKGLSLPPPPAPPVPPSSTSNEGDDWDDEDDKTTVYTRGELGDSNYPLLSPHAPVTGGIREGAPPPMSRPSAPVPSAPNQTMTSLRRLGAAPHHVAPASVPPGPTATRTPLILAGLAAVVLAIGLFFVLRPSTGGLVVTVAGPGGQPLDAVEVFVDGKVKCKTSPCRLESLEAGTHMVRAGAAGHLETADAAIVVSGGQDAVHNINLARAAGTGFRISASGNGLTLHVDGSKVGPLPQELKDLEPGDHVLKVTSDNFEEWTQTISVAPNQMETIGPLKLKVTKGLAQIRAGGGASDARVVLESDGDRRSLPQLPITLHIDTSKPHTLIATKRGFESYKQVLTFEDGEAEKTFEIVMTKEGDDDAASSAASQPRVAYRAPSRSSSSSSRSSSSSSSSSSGGKATLSINSLPPSKILLDGRPLGSTPKVGVSVSAGTHTVVFSNDGKRMSKSVTLSAGESKTVVHRFK